ncbi:MAG: LemA family protein [Balneolaceae bacterium]
MEFLGNLFSFVFWVAVILLILFIFSYNKIRKLKEEVREKRSNVGGAVKKMIDIINKAGEVVKGYKGFEQFTQLKVSQDNTATGLMSTVQQSSTMMATLQDAAHRFPDLKASGLYQDLMNDIRESHSDIERMGQEYNKAVKDYNSVALGFPAVLFSRFVGFRKEQYLNFDTHGMEEHVGSLAGFESDDDERIQQLLGSAGNQIAGKTRKFALQAGQMGKMLANKIKERSQHQYFYMMPGGKVPKGPLTLEAIQEKLELGELESDILLAESGSDDWKTLGELLIDSTNNKPEKEEIRKNPPESLE